MSSPAPRLGDSEIDIATLKLQQELKNLQVAEEKMRQELIELRRPYLFRNPQLLTALITTLGAIIGISILVSDNYFKAREQLNKLTEEKTARVKIESENTSKAAEKAVADAKAKLIEAADTMKQATQITASAQQQIKDAERHIDDANLKRIAAETSAAHAERQTKIAQRKFFSALILPEAMASNLDHVSRIDIDHQVKDLSWLPKGLRELSIHIYGVDILHAVAKDIPPEIRKLSLSSNGMTLDLNMLPSKLISLNLANVSAEGFSHLQHLEELS